MSKIPSLETCEDFLRGDHLPVNSIARALLAKTNASQLRERAKREMESIEAYQKSMDKLRAQRQQIEKNAASRTAAPKPAAPAPAARPFIRDCTQNLVLCVRRNLFKGEQHAAALAELKARNVTVHKRGYSVTAKKSH